MEGLRTLCWLVLFQHPRRLDASKPKYLLLDGTTWDYGDQTIHLMTLCVLMGEVAVPIWWEDLAKADHSSQEERITMLKEAMSKYNLKGMILLISLAGLDYTTHLPHDPPHLKILLANALQNIFVLNFLLAITQGLQAAILDNIDDIGTGEVIFFSDEG